MGPSDGKMNGASAAYATAPMTPMLMKPNTNAKRASWLRVRPGTRGSPSSPDRELTDNLSPATARDRDDDARREPCLAWPPRSSAVATPAPEPLLAANDLPLSLDVEWAPTDRPPPHLDYLRDVDTAHLRAMGLVIK